MSGAGFVSTWSEELDPRCPVARAAHRQEVVAVLHGMILSQGDNASKGREARVVKDLEPATSRPNRPLRL